MKLSIELITLNPQTFFNNNIKIKKVEQSPNKFYQVFISGKKSNILKLFMQIGYGENLVEANEWLKTLKK